MGVNSRGTGDRQVRRYDFAVIGGGPAGCAAALTLLKRPGVSVAVIEQSDFEGVRIGESLSPGVRSLLEYLGVWQAFAEEQTLPTYGNQAAWGSDEMSCLDFMLTIHGSGWGLDRTRFDRMLATAVAKRGGELLTRTRCLSCEPVENHWLVGIQDADGVTDTIASRCVIDAAGRNSGWSIRRGAVRQYHDRLVGIAAQISCPSGNRDPLLTRVEACAYGWWYCAPIPGNRLSMALMTDSHLAREQSLGEHEVWLSRLGRTRHLAQYADPATLLNSPQIFPAFSARLLLPDVGSWIAVGDSLASHDPLSANGIPHALGSGIQGARTAADDLFGPGNLRSAFIGGVQSDYSRYLSTRQRYYAMERRWPLQPFWAARTTSVQLDPRALLVSADGADRHRSIFISRPSQDKLLELARAPIAAHELVSQLRIWSRSSPDEQIVLAVQDLLAMDALRIVDRGDSKPNRMC